MYNRGKQFEQRFKTDIDKIIQNNGISLRIPDQMSGYKITSQNLCDYIIYFNHRLFLIECKTHKGNTFPLQCFTQYKKLVKKVGIPGVRCGVVLWFIEHDKILYIPVSTFTKLYKDGKKSFNIKMIGDDRYKSIEIPSKKLIHFMESDYSVLLNLTDEEGQ